MRVLTQGELNRFTKAELFALLRRIGGQLPDLKEGSAELHNAHVNLQNIRRRSRGRISGLAEALVCAGVSRGSYRNARRIPSRRP
jgi:hypothetical protein